MIALNSSIIKSNTSAIDNIKRHLNNIMAIGNIKYNLNDYNYIPTIRYKEHISCYAKLLPDKCGFDRFAILIVYNDTKFWISNTYDDLAIPHDIYQLSQLDLSNLDTYYRSKDHFFPSFDIVHPIYDLYKDLLQNVYQFYTIYTLVRACHDCHILLFAGSKSNPGDLNNCKITYKQTYKEFENFSIDVLNNTMFSLLLTSQNLRLSRIYNDELFRKNLIHGKYTENFKKLTEQEIICLHWSSLGKTAEETSSILNISPHTVRQHLKDTIAKLNAANVTNAVYKATILNLL